MAFYRGPKMVTDSLIMYLDAGNVKSYPGTGVDWFDRSGNGLNGTFTQRNSTQTINYTSDNMGSLIFPGTDADSEGGVSVRFTNNDLFLQDSQFTIEIWLKNEVVNTDEFIIMNGVGTLNGEQHNYVIRKSLNSYRFYLSDGTNSTLIISGVPPLVSVHQVVVSVDYSSNIDFYLNGSLRETVLSPYADYLGSNNRMEIGGLASGGGDDKFFTGSIYKAILYNKKLTSDEVLQNYNSSKYRYVESQFSPNEPGGGFITEGLVLHLDAGDPSSYPGSGSTWSDLSGNGYDALLINNPTFDETYGGVIKVDGQDDYIQIPSNSNRNNTIKNSTFSIIFSDSRLVTSGNINNGLYLLSSLFNCLWRRGGDTVHYVRVNNVTQSILELGAINEDVIYLTLSIDENYLTKIYINGTLRSTYDFSGNSIDYNWSYALEFGRNISGNYDAFDYYMISLYDRALTKNEVLQNYSALKSRFNI